MMRLIRFSKVGIGSMRSKWRAAWKFAGASALALTVGGLGAAPDDRVEAPRAEQAAAAAQVQFNIAPENFDQWVFPGVRNASGAKERLQSQVKLQLDELTRHCGLTPLQQKKLLLAASGDTQRFLEEVEVVRKKFLEVRQDQNGFNAIWQEIQPLQMKQAAGLYGASSIFGKTLQKTLAPEQIRELRMIEDERRQFRYRASIDLSLLTIENAVPFRHAQRERLIELLVDRTEPPQVFGQYDHYVVLLRLSQLPEDAVKPLLDERQWKLLQAQFAQARGLEQFLVQNGVLDRDRVKALRPSSTRNEHAPADASRAANQPSN